MGNRVGWPADFLKGMRFKLLINENKGREKYKITLRERNCGSFYESAEKVSFLPAPSPTRPFTGPQQSFPFFLSP